MILTTAKSDSSQVAIASAASGVLSDPGMIRRRALDSLGEGGPQPPTLGFGARGGGGGIGEEALERRRDRCRLLGRCVRRPHLDSGPRRLALSVAAHCSYLKLPGSMEPRIGPRALTAAVSV